MNIGRDMVGTMTNTLILAFLGSGFTLILYLYSLGLSFRQLMSSAYVSMEVVSGVASSVGVILSIPLTALITAAVFTREKQQSWNIRRAQPAAAPFVYSCIFIRMINGRQKEKSRDIRIVFCAKGIYNGEKFSGKFRGRREYPVFFRVAQPGAPARTGGHASRRAKRTV